MSRYGGSMHVPIVGHRRAPGSPGDGTHRWQVELQDARVIDVELPGEERASLELSDDELHDLLPAALDRHAEAAEHDVMWDAPVRLFADHFRG